MQELMSFDAPSDFFDCRAAFLDLHGCGTKAGTFSLRYSLEGGLYHPELPS
jgi:hypothetical protein